MKTRMITVLFTVLGLIAGAFSFSTDLSAQEGRGNGRLKGFVLDSDKKPVEGAKVVMEYKDFNRTLTETSDKEGKFIFVTLGPGVVQIVAEKEGYAPSGIGLKVSGVNKNPIQHIVLKKPSEMKVKDPEVEKNDELRSKVQKADDLFEERKFSAALAIYQDFQKSDPQFYKVGIRIGSCFLEMQRYNEAIAEFKKVLEKMQTEKQDENSKLEIAKLYASIGVAYMRQDNLQEAEVNFKKSIDISPNDHALAYNVAEILFVAGKTDDAIKYYDMAIKINPKFAKSFMQRGYAFLNKGDIKKAIHSFNSYLELAPDSAEADGVREVIKSLQ